MKKLIALLLTGVIVLSMAACGTPDENQNRESASTQDKKEIKLG
ncbi:hypothetical protein SAMN02745945_02022 [Peptoclostridium litorale DSM 5388]|uniref:Uncharacterized protein n=1 Tax=Peptoclostridium litorale DSM 5388 TaxID=1121324 RepID=A0A069RQ34_PEPLI|nr:hypothetical protein [Peptoclostridium litorale]KDR96292.1 hypothetical protein CLIT_4c01290 [Peptoclostridium litorale DSM 5388]SIO15362.1 hypothetical protein SAMN02745945_02022 [Peptoclostridium litorale DSM 5388]